MALITVQQFLTYLKYTMESALIRVQFSSLKKDVTHQNELARVDFNLVSFG